MVCRERPKLGNLQMKAATETRPALLPTEKKVEYAPTKDRAHQAAVFATTALIGDLLCVVSGLLLGFWLRFFTGLPNEMNYPGFAAGLASYKLLMIEGGLIMVSLLLSRNPYNIPSLVRFRDAASDVLYASVVWLGVFLSIALILNLSPSVSRLYVVLSAVCIGGQLLVWRYVFTRFIRAEPVANVLRQRVLIVGWNSQADALSAAIAADTAPQYEIVGCICGPRDEYQEPVPRSIRNLGSMRNIEAILQQERIDLMIVVDLDSNNDQLLELSNICERHLVQFKVVPTFFRVMLSALELESFDGVSVLGSERLPLRKPLNRVTKRAFDFSAGIVGLVLSAPVIALFAYLVYRESRGPVFYKQIRTGRDGRLFEILKIRSMRLDAESSGTGWTTENDPRRLKVGALMRRLNIDELPQFWNVVKGEMSLVGPRPERPELIRQFRSTIPHYNARHFVKPGITGWAQVNGLRGNTDLSKRILHDLYYMERWSLSFDLFILAKTFKACKNAY